MTEPPRLSQRLLARCSRRALIVLAYGLWLLPARAIGNAPASRIEPAVVRQWADDLPDGPALIKREYFWDDMPLGWKLLLGGGLAALFFWRRIMNLLGGLYTRYPVYSRLTRRSLS